MEIQDFSDELGDSIPRRDRLDFCAKQVWDRKSIWVRGTKANAIPKSHKLKTNYARLAKKMSVGLPLCFQSLKTQACLHQHLRSTSAGMGQRFMLSLHMDEHFGLFGEQTASEHTFQGHPVVHGFLDPRLPMMKTFSMSRKAPWRSGEVTSVIWGDPQTVKCPLLLQRWWGPESSHPTGYVLERQPTMEGTCSFWKGSPSECSLIGIRRAWGVQTKSGSQM